MEQGREKQVQLAHLVRANILRLGLDQVQGHKSIGQGQGL